jgi:hypothetical protein
VEIMPSVEIEKVYYRNTALVNEIRNTIVFSAGKKVGQEANEPAFKQ